MIRLVELHYIQVPWLGPCATCGLAIYTAETHAETWLCPGWCTDSYLHMLREAQRAQAAREVAA